MHGLNTEINQTAKCPGNGKEGYTGADPGGGGGGGGVQGVRTPPFCLFPIQIAPTKWLDPPFFEEIPLDPLLLKFLDLPLIH